MSLLHSIPFWSILFYFIPSYEPKFSVVVNGFELCHVEHLPFCCKHMLWFLFFKILSYTVKHSTWNSPFIMKRCLSQTAKSQFAGIVLGTSAHYREISLQCLHEWQNANKFPLYLTLLWCPSLTLASTASPCLCGCVWSNNVWSTWRQPCENNPALWQGHTNPTVWNM